MMIIDKTPTFFAEGALVPTKEELSALISGLKKDRETGPMALQKTDTLIEQLEEYRKQRGA
jgi:hypothetical protein